MALTKVRLAVEKDVMSVEKCLKEMEENNTAVHIHEEERLCLRSLTKRVQNLLTAVQSDKLKVVFLGKTGTGKSSIINALLREDILPSGYGGVTSNVCSIEGVVGPTSRATVLDMISGHEAECPLPLRDMVNSTSKIIQVFFPQERCPLLGEGVVLFDTPGMNADEEMDDFLKKTCSDADVFVYVCDGTCTIENTEMKFLVRIKHILSNLTSNNLFILFNCWDVVCSERDASEVRGQHLAKSRKFLVDEFDFEEESVKNSIFFISAKEVLAIHQETAKLDLSFPIKNRFTEFESFKNRLKECLTTNGVQTRFGRHRDSVRLCSEDIIAILEKTKRVVDEKRKCAVSAKEEAEETLAATKDAVVDYEREIEERCHSAVGKFNQKFDKTVAELTLTLSEIAHNFLGDFVYGKEDAYKNDLLHQLLSEVHKANGSLHRELTCVYDDTEKVLKEYGGFIAFGGLTGYSFVQLHGLPYFTIEAGKVDISSAIGFVGFLHFLCSFKHWSKLGGLKTVAFLVSIIMAFFFSLFGISVAMFCLLPASITSGVTYKALVWYWSGFKKDAVTNLVLKCLIDEIDDQKQDLRQSCCRKMTERLHHSLGECRTVEKVKTLRKDLEERVEEVELLSKQAQQIINIILRLQNIIS